MLDLPVGHLLRLAGALHEHALPDGSIEPADPEVWKRFLTMLNESGWMMVLGEEAVDAALRVEDLFRNGDRKTLKIWPDAGSIQINVFPGDYDSILFDFATAELVDQRAADCLAMFIRRCGEATDRPVKLWLEGDFTQVFATYEPQSDRFAQATPPAPPHQGSPPLSCTPDYNLTR